MNEEFPKAVLVAVQLPDVSNEALRSDLDELGRLAKTLGLDVIGEVTQKRPRLRPGTVLGVGKLGELAAWTGGDGDAAALIPGRKKAIQRKERMAAREAEAETDVDDEDGDAPDEDDDGSAGDDTRMEVFGPPDGERAKVVVVDHDLSPTMLRNLERATGAEVLDRAQVIIEIFHRHAKSREARAQVEIARLTYVAPRLREAGAGADRQRGGIGGKGAGESAVELDRRKIRDRIAELRREIEELSREQKTRRVARRDQRRVALVGYTNAGKSSMMRALTSSGVYVADKLFATLDTTVRALRPEVEPRILISDTVGFIKKLPHELVASFRSTLDEALEASLLLFVVDASDPQFREQLDVVREVLGDIGATDCPSKLVLNKRDRLSDSASQQLQEEFPEALLLSAKDPDDVLRLRGEIIAFFDGEAIEADLFVPYAAQRLVNEAYQRTDVLSSEHDERGTRLRVRAPRAAVEQLEKMLATNPSRSES